MNHSGTSLPAQDGPHRHIAPVPMPDLAGLVCGCCGSSSPVRRDGGAP